MIEVVIIEDEQLAARELEKMLLNLRPDQIQITAHVENVKDAVKYLSSHKPDLIFIDIHLGDGNSFGIFDKISVDSPLIFTTAYDQYAIQAFKQNSVDYLLKPIDPDDLEMALQKFEKRYQKKESIDLSSLQHSLNHLVAGNAYQERFMVNLGDRLCSLEVDKIAYFMADGKSLYLFDLEGHRYLCDATLSSLENKLDPKRFFRINRKFMVSYASIIDMHYYSKTRIKLNLKPDQAECIDAIVSQDRCNDFKKWLND